MADLGKALGRRIKQLRMTADLTQQQLADGARIDVKYVADLEHGRRSPSLEVLGRLMMALRVEPYELFAFTLKGKGRHQDGAADAVAALVRRARASDKQLIVNLARTVIRSRGKEKK